MSDRPTSDDLAAQHRWHAIEANNATWELIDEAAAERASAGAVEIVDDEDRSIFEADLAAGPWFGLSPD